MPNVKEIAILLLPPIAIAIIFAFLANSYLPTIEPIAASALGFTVYLALRLRNDSSNIFYVILLLLSIVWIIYDISGNHLLQ